MLINNIVDIDNIKNSNIDLNEYNINLRSFKYDEIILRSLINHIECDYKIESIESCDDYLIFYVYVERTYNVDPYYYEHIIIAYDELIIYDNKIYLFEKIEEKEIFERYVKIKKIISN